MPTLKLGTPDQFSTVRDSLARAGYTERAVCRKLGIASLHEYSGNREKCDARVKAAPASTLRTLIQLFLLGESLGRTEVEKAIPGAALAVMKSLGILRPHSRQPKRWFSPVVLYPLRDLYIASDRWKTLDGSPTAKDYVFPAIHPFTHEFLGLLPRDPCDKFLDLCSGTAIAALIAAKGYARHAWAVDITLRSTRFGEFNRRLNALENATVLRGDIYKPVGSLKFDRIAVHPPYVPSLKRRPIYADGGQDGESITRAIVQGLPRHLAPGGRFYCLATGVEREGEPYEQRVRKWLGARKAGFNIVYIEAQTQGPLQFAYRTTQQAKGAWDEMDKWVAHFRKLKIKNLVYGLLVIQASGNRKGFTVRRRKGESCGLAEVEWLRRWESAWADPARRERVMAAHPVASGNTELHVVYAAENGRFSPSQFTLKSAHPFIADYDCPAWVAALVQRCGGTATALELFEAGKREGWIHPDLTEDEFTATIGELVSLGIIVIPEFAPPGPAQNRPIP